MSYVQLFELLPDVAMAETREIKAFEPNIYNVPPGEYGLIEMYCNDENCDCRRVFLTVVSSVTQRPVATIAFGWESRKFYEKWYYREKDIEYSAMRRIDRIDRIDIQAIDFMHGIHLNTTGYQSPIAEAVLKMVTEQALNDKAYVDRLKHHYKLFREKVDNQYRDKKTIRFPTRRP